MLGRIVNRGVSWNLVGAHVSKLPARFPVLLRSSAPPALCVRKLATETISPAKQVLSKKKHRLLRILGWGAVLGTLASATKVYFALRPLIISGPAEKSIELISMPDFSKMTPEEAAITWRVWLVSEASDRLIRNVYVAAQIVQAYMRAIQTPGLEDWSAVHTASAERLLKLVQVNKGVYIKLGQIVAQLEYMLPIEYVRTLAPTTHACPIDAWEDVQKVWAQEFNGQNIEDAFFEIDRTPIASASLAQVHVAYLKGANGQRGKKVAVKVQHAGLRETSAADIFTVVFLVRVVKAIFPKFDYQWLADEIQENLPNELNFLKECDNAERCRSNFAHRKDIIIPTVYYGLTTPRVLTMSFEDGTYANKVHDIRAQGIDPAAVARLVSEVFSEQIFVHGYCHADPHAANVLIRRTSASNPKPTLVLLDHGLYREVSPDVRFNYAKMWRSIIMGDERGIKKYASRLNAGEFYQLFASILTTRSWDKILAAADNIDSLQNRGSAAEKSETMGYAKEYSDEIQVVLRKIPRELLLILKTNDCLRAIDISLGAPVNNLIIVARYCQTALNNKRADSRPGLLTWISSTVDTASLELRLSAFQWTMALARNINRVTSVFAPRPKPAAASVTAPASDNAAVALQPVNVVSAPAVASPSPG